MILNAHTITRTSISVESVASVATACVAALNIVAVLVTQIAHCLALIVFCHHTTININFNISFCIQIIHHCSGSRHRPACSQSCSYRCRSHVCSDRSGYTCCDHLHTHPHLQQGNSSLWSSWSHHNIPMQLNPLLERV